MIALRFGTVARVSLLAFAVGCGDTSPAAKDDPAAAPGEAPSKPSTPPEPVEPAAPETPATVTPTDPLTDPSVAALLTSIGDGPMLSFVVRPRRWEAAGGALAAMLGDAAPPPLRAITGASTGPEIVQQLGRHVFGIDATKLKGIDPVRPWVGGFGEVADASLLELPSDGADGTKFKSYGVRHVLLVPVSDGKAFVESFGPTFVEATPIDGWFSGSAPSYSGKLRDQGFVTASVEGDYVRVVVFNQVHNVSPQEGKAALASRLGPTPSTLEPTPALRELTTRESVGGLHLRPWRFRRWAVASGRYQMFRAIESAPADQRSTMLAMGMSVLLNAEILMVDDALELDDWSYLLEAKGARIDLLAVGSLTPHGAKVWDAARTDVALLPGAKSSTAVLEGSLRMDLNKVLAATKPHQGLGTSSPGHAQQKIFECGSACGLHLLHRTPLQLLATMASWAPTAPGPLPSVLALQTRLLGLDPPSGAVAVIAASKADAKAFNALEAFRNSLGTLGTFTEVTRGKEGTLQLGLGGSHEAAFGNGDQPSRALLELRGTISTDVDTPVGRLAKPMFGALKLERQGATLVAQLVASTDVDPVTDYKADPSGTTWASPIFSAPGGDKTTCVAEAAGGIQEIFSAVATVAPETRATVIDAGLKELEDVFTCSGGSPDAKARVATLRATVQQLAKTLQPPK